MYMSRLELEEGCSRGCGWLWIAVAQWSEHLQLKQEALCSIPGGCPGFVFFFLFQLAYTNADRMKELWRSSTVWLLSTQM